MACQNVLRYGNTGRESNLFATLCPHLQLFIVLFFAYFFIFCNYFTHLAGGEMGNVMRRTSGSEELDGAASGSLYDAYDVDGEGSRSGGGELGDARTLKAMGFGVRELKNAGFADIDILVRGLIPPPLPKKIPSVILARFLNLIFVFFPSLTY